MQVLNFGSLNIDHVYTVDHFVAPGETLSSSGYQINAGGKGLNQSVALGRAGVKTFHAGMIGNDGLFLKKILEDSNVNTDNLIIGALPTGHAVIQVEKGSAQNSILLYPGANQPLPSIRLANIRDGSEDYDYLTLCGISSREECSRLITNLKEFSRDPALLRQMRRQIAGKIIGK